MNDKAFTRRGILLSGVATGALAVGDAVGGSPGERAPPSAWSRRKKYQQVRGLRMAYYETGVGDPIVFLHGNPTSSYLWRKVIPHVAALGRCIAPDLLGMGDSAKLAQSDDASYRYPQHRDYLFALLDALDVRQRVILVVHDWGSALGLDWARQHPERVRGIAHMEAIFRPPGAVATGQPAGGYFSDLRSERGEALVLQENMFVERMLIDGLQYYLTEEDAAEYRRPYLTPGESRRPTLSWPRELPIDGEPARNEQLVQQYTGWFATADLPKLFVRVVPGAILRDPAMLALARGFSHQSEALVYGGHFVQEVSGDAIGRAVAGWIRTQWPGSGAGRHAGII